MRHSLIKFIMAGAPLFVASGADAEPEAEPEPMQALSGTGQDRLRSFREEARKLPPAPMSQQTVNHYRATRPPQLDLSNKATRFVVKIVGFSDEGVVYQIAEPPADLRRLQPAQRNAILRQRYHRTARMTGDTHDLLRNHVGETMVLDIRTDKKGFGYVVAVNSTRSRTSK